MPSLYTAVGSCFQRVGGDVMLVMSWAKKGTVLIPGAKNLLLV